MEPPVARGLLICEHVQHDTRTRRLTLVDRTTSVRFRRFPTEPFTVFVFAGLTNGFGRVPIVLEIEHLESQSVVGEYPTVIEFADPLREVPYVFAVRDVRYPAAGTYEFALVANGEPIASQVLRLSVRPSSGGSL